MSDPVVSYPPGCDNSPKNRLMVKIGLFLLGLEDSALMGMIDEDTIWQRQEDAPVKGQTAIVAATTSRTAVEQIEITNVATHGKVGFVDGVFTSEKRVFGFCVKVIFKSAAANKIARIVSY